ncbi:MAG: hypothetical protein JOZ69_23000 [Myxococcales bacterium]|nr:hypothetical protein [Myxococcales bacterium]
MADALRSVFDPLRLWNEDPKPPAAVGGGESAAAASSRGSEVSPPLFATGSAAQLMTTTLPLPTAVVPEAAALGALGKSTPHLAPGHGRADSTGKWPALRS